MGWDGMGYFVILLAYVVPHAGERGPGELWLWEGAVQAISRQGVSDAGSHPQPEVPRVQGERGVIKKRANQAKTRE